MRSILMFGFELLLVAIGLFTADLLQDTISFIPRMIIHLPDVDYTRNDFYTVVQYFLICHSAVFIFLRWRFGVWNPDNAARTVENIFGLALAFSISSLSIFVTTSVAFDPNFIVGIALITVTLFILTHLMCAFLSGSAISRALVDFFSRLIRRVFTISGVLMILAAFSPGILAKFFVSDRDVANVVTQIRIYFTQQGDEEFGFNSVFGSRKFLQPMMVRPDPVDSSLVYVLERAGRILSVDYPKGEREQVVLDIADDVGLVESENGALGFAFHPDFGNQRRDGAQKLFLYYTTVLKGAQVNRLSQFTVHADSPKMTNASELSLLVLPREPSGYHNGGSVEFGPDGFLYLALGEGVHTKSSSSQSETLRGGIIRIDIDCREGNISRHIVKQPAEGETANYCIPLDNPFLEAADLMEEYWAVGLRNPFRVSFDTVTGSLWAGDVGSTKWEEINVIEKGGHYQFPYLEGYEKTRKKVPGILPGKETEPLFAYIHTAFDRAVIGGFVYHGAKFKNLDGKYLFADNYSSRIFSMAGTGEKVKTVSHIATANQYAQRGVSSLSQLPNGDVIVTTLGRSGSPTGEVLKMVESKNVQKSASTAQVEESYSNNEINELYILNCARCHGRLGAGDGPDVSSLGVAMPDFSNFDGQLDKKDEYYKDVIIKGGHETGLSPLMPAWGHLLSEGEVDGLVKLLRQFGGHNH